MMLAFKTVPLVDTEWLPLLPEPHTLTSRKSQHHHLTPRHVTARDKDFILIGPAEIPYPLLNQSLKPGIYHLLIGIGLDYMFILLIVAKGVDLFTIVKDHL